MPCGAALERFEDVEHAHGGAFLQRATTLRRRVARVLVLTNHYPPHSYGGYELACADVVQRWRETHDVAVLTSTVDDAETDELVWRRLPMTWINASPPPRWRRPSVERQARRILDAAIDGFRPDVISVWNLAGLPFGLLGAVIARGTPAVAVIADAWLLRAPEEDPWMRAAANHRWVVGAVARLAGVPTTVDGIDDGVRFAFASESMRRAYLDASRWRFPHSEIVPLGVNLDDFPLAPVGAKPWRHRLLYVGRLDATKGIDTAVRAMAALPDEELDVVGPAEPHHMARLRDVAAQAGVTDRIRFSSAARGELARRYREADAFVFPSEWDEPFGIVPLEAMASGTAVVATGTGGSGEYLVDGVNCVRFAPGDAGGLAAAVQRVARDQRLRDRLIAGGLDTAARLSITSTADRLDAIQTAVIQSRRVR